MAFQPAAQAILRYKTDGLRLGDYLVDRILILSANLTHSTILRKEYIHGDLRSKIVHAHIVLDSYLDQSERLHFL